MTESRVDALLDAAEQLFASDGIEGASLRAVMRQANADPGSIHYHFGSREALAVAVLERVLGPLNDRRLVLLDEAAARAASSVVPLVELVEALVRPDIEAATELHGRGEGRARLIGAIYVNPAKFVKVEVERHFSPVARRFMPFLSQTLPEVPAGLLSWRVRWFVFGVLGALMSDDHEVFAADPNQLLADLAGTISAALAAGVPLEGSSWK